MSFSFFMYKRKKFLETSLENDVVTKYFLDKTELSLRNSSVSNIVRTKTEISYKGAIFRFVWNGWNYLNGISSYSLHLTEKNNGVQLEQRLYFTEFFVIALCFTTIPLALSYNPEWSLLSFIVIWILFYSISISISINSVNKFTNKIILEIYEKENSELNKQLESGVFG